MFSFLLGQFVNSCIASYPADKMGICRTSTGQCGVKAVRRGHKLSLRKPVLYFLKHLLGKFDKAGAIFPCLLICDKRIHLYRSYRQFQPAALHCASGLVLIFFHHRGKEEPCQVYRIAKFRAIVLFDSLNFF